MNRLLCFGLGYTARALAGRLAGAEWQISGTAREGGGEAQRFDRAHPLPPEAFAGVTHILVSIPPDEFGDPVLDAHRQEIAALMDRPPAGNRAAAVGRLSVDHRSVWRSRRRLGR